MYFAGSCSAEEEPGENPSENEAHDCGNHPYIVKGIEERPHDRVAHDEESRCKGWRPDNAAHADRLFF